MFEKFYKFWDALYKRIIAPLINGIVGFSRRLSGCILWKRPSGTGKLVKWHVFAHRILAVGVLLAGLLLAFYAYIVYFLPLPDYISNIQEVPTTKIFDRHGELLYEVLQPDFGKKTTIPLSQIPKGFINATLAAEDINFYSHPGLDFWAIGRAIFFNVREQRVVSGASTITQQLVRNLIAASRPANQQVERGYGDKILEAMYAVRISNVYSKDQVLELYLNRIYYGNMAYGAESAALDYFGNHIYDLDLAQSSFIAGLPQSPSYYNPFVYFERAKKRQSYVLDQMAKYGFITSGQAESAKNEPLKLRSNKFRIKAPHFVNYVINQLEEKYGEDFVIRGGLTVKTTLDYNLQLEAEDIIDRQVGKLSRNNVKNGALVSLDVKTGQILAWVGSRDYFDPEIDGAVDVVSALRQPGSSIKPLTYLLALEKGYTPATVIYDIPTQFNTDSGAYTPQNYDLDYHGPVRVRTALASSFNIPAVKTLDFVGTADFIGFLRRLGIDTLTAPPGFYGLALTLGGGEVRLIDMANAFNVIANYGIKKESAAILEVTNQKGESIFRWVAKTGDYVLGSHGKEHAYQIIDILKDPLARIPGFGEGSVLEISHQAAVKTGTTRNFKDNWTIGFTPQILTAVWVGNSDASAMENVTGVTGAAPIWADFMEAALANKPKLEFAVPSGIIEKEVCAISGKLPTSLCPDKIYEIFVKGTEPTEYDDYYKSYWINKANGKIVDEACVSRYSSDQLDKKTLLVYPNDLQKWAASKRLDIHQKEPCSGSSGYTEAYPDTYSNEQPATQQAFPDAIIIDSPLSDDEYMPDSTLPINSQKIPIRITAPVDTTKVTYFVDNREVGTATEIPFTFLWLPEKGDHLLKVTANLVNGKTVESKPVYFHVR